MFILSCDEPEKGHKNNFNLLQKEKFSALWDEDHRGAVRSHFGLD